MKNLCFIVFAFFTFQTSVLSQDVNNTDSDKNILTIYRAQLSALFKTRSLSDAEINSYLNKNSSTLSSIEDFAKILGNLYPEEKETAVLLYFFNKDSLFRILIEPGKIIQRDVILIPRSELQDLSTDLFNSLDIERMTANRSPRLRGAHPISADTVSSKKYILDSVLAKATRILLPSKFDNRYCHLIVIPTLNIGTFPFSLLKPYKDGKSLIDHCSYIVAPGLIDLVTCRTKLKMVTNLAPGQLAWFTFEKPLFVCNPAYPTNTSYDFPELPGAKKEIENILPWSGNYKLLEGAAATKEEVMKGLRNCDVAYFATHGIASEKRPMDSSFVVLSGNTDPFLTAQDVVNMRDSTASGKLSFPEMVILSACQTGLGKSMEAGVAGLARSFMMAGANHIIMSLWNVDDNATAYMMNRFVYYLRVPGLHIPTEPLRLAALDTREKFKDPSQWASFSVFGIDY